MNKHSSFYNGSVDCFQSKIKIVKLQFTLKAKKTGRISPYSGSIWRGMWGREIRRRTCVNQNVSCENCSFLQSCPYGSIFEPDSKTFAPELAGYMKYISPPYVINPPIFEEGIWQAEQEVNLELTLFGDFFRKAHYFIESLFDIAEYGVGEQRIPFTIESIKQVDDSSKQLLTNEKINSIDYQAIIPHTLVNDRKKENINQVLINFETPARLQKEGQFISYIDAESFLTSCIRRIHIISNCYSEKTVEITDEQISRMLMTLQVRHSSVIWRDWKRYSGKQKREMSIGGIVGSFTLTGLSSESLQIIEVASQLHIGKQTVFGLGKFSVWKQLN